jgi:PncC family amidohydrolase
MFKMVRNHDETGVSGTGVVADGIEFSNGIVSVCWRSKTPSVNVYRSFVEFKHVHIDAHPSNDTEILWAEVEGPEPKKMTALSSNELRGIVGLLASRNFTIGFAESCTGGRLAADLTTVPGSSDIVRGSFVTYQLEGKRRMLGLNDVNDENVVSEATAQAMAEGAHERLGTDVVVAVTGYLDPDTPGGPHAYVAFLWPQQGKNLQVAHSSVARVDFAINATRSENREKIVAFALRHVKELIGSERETR